MEVLAGMYGLSQLSYWRLIWNLECTELPVMKEVAFKELNSTSKKLELVLS